MNLRRKDATATTREAAAWLRRTPALIPAFFLAGVFDAASVNAPILWAVGFALLVVFGGVAHRIARAQAAGAWTGVLPELGPVLRRLPSLLGAWILYTLAVVVGLVAFVVPGIYLAVRLSLAFPAIVIDDQRAVEGLSTSWHAAKSNLPKLLGIALLAFVATFSTLLVVAVVGRSTAVALAVSPLLTAIVAPVVELSYARVYLENRETAPSVR